MKFEKIVKMATDIVKGGEEHSPTMFMCCGNEIATIMFPLDPETKQTQMDMLRKLVQKKKPDKYILVYHVWMVRVEHGQNPSIRPSESKHREELLFIQEFTRDGFNQALAFPVLNNPRRLGEPRDFDGCQSTSLWNFYLEKEGVEERMDKTAHKAFERYVKDKSKELAKSMTEQLDSAKTNEEKMDIFIKILKGAVVDMHKDRREKDE